ncbi:MAG TPA: hypothetical protein VGG72_31840 [Bryobacteraceae bacterium]|jgi:hydroxyacid-oxoacid transhydrogenase
MNHETAFEMAASGIRFGAGITREAGMDLAGLGVRNVLVITDPVLRGLRPLEIVLESLEANGAVPRGTGGFACRPPGTVKQ